MRAKRYKIIINNKINYSWSNVVGLMKGMLKGQAVVVVLDDQSDPPYVIVRVKVGLEDFFIGQTRSFGYKVEEKE